MSDPNYTLKEVTDDALAYYLRRGEAPGRWTGAGAARLGLAGQVAPADLHDLFAGKDPRSGEYLTPARGSAGRVAARSEDVGIDVRAAAARLSLKEDTVRARLRAGKLEGEKTQSGRWRVSAASVDAALAGAPDGGLAVTPGPDGCLSLAQAAKVAAVHPSYLKRIVTAQAPESGAGHDGRPAQYLLAAKDEKGHWRVDSAEVRRFMQERRPARVVPVYDLVLRAPKSVAVLHALAPLLPSEELMIRGLPDNLAETILEAHHAACGDALTLLERHAAFVRGPGGRVPVHGLTVAAFDHRSSREGDPLLHTHHLIANAGEGIDGRKGALDGAAFYTWAKAAGHVYHARLRHELSARLGVEFHAPHHGLADLSGVPREVIDEFSERSRQIARQLARVGASGPRAAQAAALDTRVAKDEAKSQTPEEIAERAARHGFGLRDLLGCLRRSAAQPPDQHRVDEVARHLASPDGLTAHDTRIGLRDALCGYANALPEGAAGADVERWSRRLLADPRRFVPVLGAPARSPSITRMSDGKRIAPKTTAERAYSTPELLGHEHAILQAHRSGLGNGTGVGAGIAAPQAVAVALAERPTLRGEQTAMVRRVTTSGLGVEVVVGGPGTGKTFALGAAAEAWRETGYRVIGAALQGGAAETLAAEADLDERYTLTALIGACDRHGAGRLDGAVVIVDEAGMADTRQLAVLARYAQAAGAKLVLVGDPDQLPEVGAGGAFARLVTEAGPHLVTLRENHRQVHDADRRRLDEIRHGRAGAALASAQDDGRLHVADTADELREQLLADWTGDPGEPGRDKLLVAFTIAETERLNTLARAILTAQGTLGGEAITIPCTAPDRVVESRELEVGDRVRATRNDYRVGVLTGRVGTVTVIDAQATAVTVVFDADRDRHGRTRPGRTVAIDAAFLHERQAGSRAGTARIQPPGLTHAYASTAHAVQGRTTRRGYVLLTEAGLSRQGAYVACSRAKLDTHLYAITVPDLDEQHRHDRHHDQPEPDDLTAVARAMARDASQDLASAADPRAPEVALLVSKPTAWLLTEHDALAGQVGSGPPLEEALRVVRTALATAYQLPLASLECAPLRAAMTSALRLPGATPERLAGLMLERGGPDRTELDTAKDPVAVLVWAARHRALPVMASESRSVAASTDPSVSDRLRVIDSALARQRESRLGDLETATDHPIVHLLGAAPAHPAGLQPWRRAAAAVLDYRDAARLFDSGPGGREPWTGALGCRPSAEGLAAHYDQAVSVVADSRAALVLAELPRHALPLSDRTPLGVASAANAELEPDLAQARRAARLRHDALADPPEWIRSDVAARTRPGSPALPSDLGRLAAAYAEVAMAAERVSGPPNLDLVEELLQREAFDAGPQPVGHFGPAGETLAANRGL